MQVRHVDLNASLDVERGAVAVCIPIKSPPKHLIACVGSVFEHTSGDVPIVMCDVGGGTARSLESIRAMEPPYAGARELLYLRADPPAGPAAAVNRALAITAPADAVLLSPDCVVAAEWLRRMRQAAYSDSTVATASALSCGRARWDDDAAALRTRSLGLHPRLSSAAGPCVYVRRTALELVGDIDAGVVAGDRHDTEFSRRCVNKGLSHVIADDVLVLDRSNGKIDEPWISLSTDGASPLTRSLSRVRRVLRGMSVVIDARILSGPTTGTRIQVLEMIGALARTERVHLTVVVPNNLTEDAARSLESLTSVSLVTPAEAAAVSRHKPDLVHRPFQVNNPGDLSLLLKLADRLVITQEDLISYYNSSYFPSLEAWEAHRRLTRTALAMADRVVFVSAHARADALADDVVDSARASVVPNGVDHQTSGAGELPVRPLGAARLPDHADVILCLGTDYHHKNRLFAIRMLEELQRRHGWRGRLVLAGPHVAHGSSASDEERLLAHTPALSEAVLDLGAMNEAEKAWLLDHASLVVYPTVHEGFGLVPFEAANRGVPCMWSAGTSLSEVLPDDGAVIVPWDATKSADRALELLRDERARGLNVDLIRTAGKRLTWDATGARLLDVYEATCDIPSPPTATLERRYGLLSGGLSEDAMRLMGPGGALPADVERPLLALATHPRIGTPVFRALKLGYRTSYKLRRWRRSNGRGEGSVRRQSLR